MDTHTHTNTYVLYEHPIITSNYMSIRLLLNKHPTTRASPNYKGFARLLGLHPANVTWCWMCVDGFPLKCQYESLHCIGV